MKNSLQTATRYAFSAPSPGVALEVCADRAGDRCSRPVNQRRMAATLSLSVAAPFHKLFSSHLSRSFDRLRGHNPAIQTP